AAGEQGSAQIAFLQSRIAAQNEEKVKAEIASASLRAPFDGTILTKDIEFRTNEFLQPGSAFAEIAVLDNWELQIEVPEKNIGMVEEMLRDRGSIDTNFILYTQSSQILHARLSSRQQISPSAYPKEKESVFLITIQNPEIPEYMKKNL